MNTLPILPVTFAVPLGAAFLLLLIPKERLRLIQAVSAVAGVALLGLSIFIFAAYDFATGGYQFVSQASWLDAIGVTFHNGIDGLSAPMVLLTGIVAPAGVIVSFTIKERAKAFFIWLFILIAGVYGVFISLDLFFLFFFYELAVLPMYLLIGVWGSSSDFGTFKRPKEYGALKLVLYLVAGSVLVWVAILAIYAKANLGTFDLLQLQDVEFAKDFQNTYFPLLMVGFGVLAGLWPFHTWSPDGHVAAPTAVSMLHAGVLMKLGAYGILRVGMTILPEGAQTWAPVLAALATVNVVYGAISAMAQRDLKYVIGYSSVSHMGLVLIGFATLNTTGINGAVLQMFSHGIMTALFFAVVGAVYDRAHTRDITVFQGLAKRMGLTAALFTVAGLASLGLPGLSGFVAEFLVFLGMFRQYPVVAILGVVGAAITAVYILRLLAKVFFGPLDQRWAHLTDMGRFEALAAGGLAAVLVFVGVFPSALLKVIDVSVQGLVDRLNGGI